MTLRIVVINVDPGRLPDMRRIYPTLEIFEGTRGCTREDYRQVCIPDTYRRLAEWAVAEGLGRETIILQDDVLIAQGGGAAMDRYNASFDVPLLVYGQTEKTGIVVPKAFSAAPEIHVLLSEVWDGVGRIGPAWMPIVEEYGTVLDVCLNLGR